MIYIASRIARISLKSCTNSNFKFMQQSMSVTTDRDPLPGLPLTPTKRMTSAECEILLKVGWICSNIYKLWNCSNIQFLFLYCPGGSKCLCYTTDLGHIDAGL